MHALALLLSSLLLAQAAPPPQAPPPQAPAPAPDPRAEAYQLGVGDILKVTVFGHEDLTQTLIVQPDGTVSFPLVGAVPASGSTPRQLEQSIATALGRSYIRSPQVTVVVTEYRSKQVFVVGEIARPGAYPLSSRLTIVEILSRAGPVNSSAGSEVVIVRPFQQQQGPVLPSEVGEAQRRAEVIRVNVQDIQAGDLDKNLALQPGDTVFVPAAPRVYVSGEVRNSGAYPFAPGMTVRQAISLAGGFGDDASTSRLRVVRLVGGKTKELKIRIDDLVEPGDTILVKRKLF
jgi:polysaccharide export outer membrane protein